MNTIQRLVAELDELGPTSPERPILAFGSEHGLAINIMGALGCSTVAGDQIVSKIDQWNQRLWQPKPAGIFFDDMLVPRLMTHAREQKNNRSLRAVISRELACRMFLERSVSLDVIDECVDLTEAIRHRIFSHGTDHHSTDLQWVGAQFTMQHNDQLLGIGVHSRMRGDAVHIH